jgi:hypothetical protein
VAQLRAESSGNSVLWVLAAGMALVSLALFRAGRRDAGP